MVSFYAWGARGVCWLFQNEAILLFFVLHFPLHILTKLSLFLYSIECSWDYVMQITVIWVGGYDTAIRQRKNRSLMYILHNLLLRRLCQNIAMLWDIGLVRACNESTTHRTMRNAMNSLLMQSLSSFEDSGIVGTCFRGRIVQSDDSGADRNLDAIWP